MQSNKTLLLRWCIWFFLGNCLLFWLIGLNYISTVSWLGSGYFVKKQFLLVVFTILTYLGQLGLLALFPCLFLLPLILFFPKRNCILPLAVIIATVAALLLAADTIIYQLYRFHLNGIVFNLVIHAWGKEFFDISYNEILFGFFVFLSIGVFEWVWAIWLWRRFARSMLFMGLGKWTAIFLGFCIYHSYLFIFFSVNHIINRAFLEVGRVFPLYTDILGAMLPMKDGKVALERMTESYLIQPEQAHAALNYPSAPLQYSSFKKPMNIVMIAIDAWRFDMLVDEVMPNLTQFAKLSWTFTNHFSGGNATGPGIFSLFYGIPSTYWTAMEVAHRGPLFIEGMLKHHYQIGIFGSASLSEPAFHRTVFQAINDLPTVAQKGKNAGERDRIMTEKFSTFIKKVAVGKRPFFSFLFYDGAHSYCSGGNSHPFKPTVKMCNRVTLTNLSDPLPYFNRYKNALVSVDQQIKHVIDLLKRQHLYDNTIVIITGDHGEEFNDNHLGYWGHASNFTRYQVQTPLIIHWPGKQPCVFTHQTSHFDISPTLMKEALGCQSDQDRYSFGHNLFAFIPASYLIVGSYIGFGILESNRITEVFPTGSFHVEQLNGQPIQETRFNAVVMQHVLGDLRRFYKA